MNFAMTMFASTGASGVELLEALAIVLGVGVTRGFRNALIGALAGGLVIIALCLLLGRALRAGAGVGVIRVTIGTVLLLFGLEWLRKGVLRMAGRRRRASSYREFAEVRDSAAALPNAARGGPDWPARAVAFQGVFVEGLEVGLIVVALGAAPGRLVPAVLGAILALTLVVAAGVTLRKPLRRLPETQIKLAMGVALTAFGTYFAGEGLGAHWPLLELAPLYLTAVYGLTASLAVHRLERHAPAPELT